MSLPTRIARYEIVGRLASGGMAEILLARLTGPNGFDRAVVVKRILPHLASEPSFRTMFLDEARIVARIRHANVVQVQELGQDGEELFLTMEYLEGESAAAIARRLVATEKKLPLSLAAYVVAQACAGLHAAHELIAPDGTPLDLVHRDVSPQNVFVTYGGEVKVLDFGVAKAADRVTRTETGTFKGKYEYASPEQCLGQPVDRRSDVFAMGVVLYELTTGHRLFKRENPLLTMRAVCDAEVPPPSAIVAGYPSALEGVCLRALARHREARFATAAEMRTELLKVARALDLDLEPETALAHLMQDLFADRIGEKRAMLERVRAGSDALTLPANESDVEVQLPIVEGTLKATITQQDLSGAPAVTAAPSSRRSWFVLVGLVAVVALAAFAIAMRPREETPVPAASAASDIVAAAPTASTITVLVDSVPSGAEVSLAGEKKGHTPTKLVMPRSAAPQSLSLELEGHRNATQSFVPDVDQKVMLSLLPALAPAPASSNATKAARGTRPTNKTPAAAPSNKATGDGFRRFD